MTDPARQRSEPAAPPEIDLSKPSIARVYDYVLGGKANFEIDRRAANSFINALPEAPQIARDNRNFVRRGVRHLVAEAGVTQIIDIGSGLPTAGNVHEIAHEIDPTVRVVYADKDPIVLTHSRALLGDDEHATVITADLLDPDSIFNDPATRELIDLTAPYAILVSGVLHHLADAQDPAGITADLRRRLPVGGYLLASSFLDDDDPRAQRLERGFLDGGLGTGRFRTWPEIRQYFEGLEMVDPGLVYANDWRPDGATPTDSPVHTLYAGGIGRKAA